MVLRAAVGIVGGPFALFFVVAERALALQFAVFVPSLPEAFPFALFIGACFPELALFVIVGPIARLQAMVEVAFAA